LIEEETQKGKVKREINPHTPKAGNRAIVDLSKFSIIIQYPIEDGVPADQGNHEVADEKGT